MRTLAVAHSGDCWKRHHVCACKLLRRMVFEKGEMMKFIGMVSVHAKCGEDMTSAVARIKRAMNGKL